MYMRQVTVFTLTYDAMQSKQSNPAVDLPVRVYILVNMPHSRSTVDRRRAGANSVRSLTAKMRCRSSNRRQSLHGHHPRRSVRPSVRPVPCQLPPPAAAAASVDDDRRASCGPNNGSCFNTIFDTEHGACLPAVEYVHQEVYCVICVNLSVTFRTSCTVRTPIPEALS